MWINLIHAQKRLCNSKISTTLDVGQVISSAGQIIEDECWIRIWTRIIDHNSTCLYKNMNWHLVSKNQYTRNNTTMVQSIHIFSILINSGICFFSRSVENVWLMHHCLLRKRSAYLILWKCQLRQKICYIQHSGNTPVYLLV